MSWVPPGLVDSPMDWAIGHPELFIKYLVSRAQRVFLSEHSIRPTCYSGYVLSSSEGGDTEEAPGWHCTLSVHQQHTNKGQRSLRTLFPDQSMRGVTVCFLQL